MSVGLHFYEGCRTVRYAAKLDLGIELSEVQLFCKTKDLLVFPLVELMAQIKRETVAE